MSVRFLADENFNRAIVNGVLRLAPALDIVRVQDVGLRTLDDLTILEWAARDGRVLLSHDAATIPHFAHHRITAGLPIAGVFIASATMPVGAVIDDLVVVAQASVSADWEGLVTYLPL